MSKFFRAANLAAVAFCASAASGAFGSSIPDDVAAIIETPLPVIPDMTTDPAMAIDVPEGLALPPTIPPPAKTLSLAALVDTHGDADMMDNELRCLATAVYFEAKGEPLHGQLAVAEVVMNRVKSGRFASTLCGVVKQPSQFSFVRRGSFPPIANQSQWRRAVGVARVATDGKWVGPAEGALFFHARRVSPNWGKRQVASVGNHVFYR